MTRPNRILFLFVAMLAGLTACDRPFAPSETLDDYIEDEGNKVGTYYFYPSTVRMLGSILSGAGITSLNEIRQGRLLVFSEDEELSKISVDFPELKKQAESEGFELLLSVKREGTKIDAYMNNREIPTYLLFFEESTNPFIVEVIGNLSMNSISELSSLDLNKANDIFDLLPRQKEEAVDSLSNDKTITPSDTTENSINVNISFE